MPHKIRWEKWRDSNVVKPDMLVRVGISSKGKLHVQHKPKPKRRK